jgi:hypothetical protein
MANREGLRTKEGKEAENLNQNNRALFFRADQRA